MLINQIETFLFELMGKRFLRILTSLVLLIISLTKCPE